jgi:pyruvate carboxylase subunit B
MPVFDGDPLEAAPKNIAPAKQALEERNLSINDKNIFLVLAAMVPGKKMELNEGIRLLTGKAKIDVPLKKKAELAPAAAPAPVANTASPISGPVTTRCTVQDGSATRTFTITVEPAGAANTAPAAQAAAVAAPSPAIPANGTQVYSTFAGSVEVVDILVKVRDTVTKGQVIAAVEAMKAKHDIKSPCDGKVTAINVGIGDEIDNTKSILTVS